MCCFGIESRDVRVQNELNNFGNVFISVEEKIEIVKRVSYIAERCFDEFLELISCGHWSVREKYKAIADRNIECSAYGVREQQEGKVSQSFLMSQGFSFDEIESAVLKITLQPADVDCSFHRVIHRSLVLVGDQLYDESVEKFYEGRIRSGISCFHGMEINEAYPILYTSSPDLTSATSEREAFHCLVSAYENALNTFAREACLRNQTRLDLTILSLSTAGNFEVTLSEGVRYLNPKITLGAIYIAMARCDRKYHKQLINKQIFLRFEDNTENKVITQRFEAFKRSFVNANV